MADFPIRANPIDSLQWLASTVYMEAEGEPYEGKLAVAFVVANRCRKAGISVPDAVLRAWQFSAWNTDSPTRMKLDSLRGDDPVWIDCVRAATEAIFASVPDPIDGRTLYMNEKVVIRETGSLPAWWKLAGETDPGKAVGAHTFRHDI